MAKKIPSFFRGANIKPLANYSFTDIATGTGTITYYGAHSYEGDATGASNYFLTPDVVYSQFIETEGGTGFVSQTYTNRLDLDFTLTEFKFPQIIKGTAVVSIPAGIQTRSTGDRCNLYAQIFIRKWDGSSETEIANATSYELYSPVTTSAWTYDMLTVQITVPKTSFLVGEQLRLTVRFFVKTDSGTGSIGSVLGHDPANRDGTRLTPSSDATITNQLIFKCPFDIDP